jgi:cystathionine beta-lyase/cystathionine gamma-synthase
MASYSKIESALIHGGIYGDSVTGAVNTPIYQTSTYEQKGLGEKTAGSIPAPATPRGRRLNRSSRSLRAVRPASPSAPAWRR